MVLIKRVKRLAEQWKDLDLSLLGLIGSTLLLIAARRERGKRDD